MDTTLAILESVRRQLDLQLQMLLQLDPEKHSEFTQGQVSGLKTALQVIAANMRACESAKGRGEP